MAELGLPLDITVEELEENLGAKKLPSFIAKCEESFIGRIEEVCKIFCEDKNKRAIFISGPTSSGKTTFTKRLTAALKRNGRVATFLSLDDYYVTKDLTFDKDGRPDFETIEALDVNLIAEDIKKIIDGKRVLPPIFSFSTRKREERDPNDFIELPDNGVLVVEGLHGLSSRISGNIPEEKCTKIFIMPYGNVYCDTKLMDPVEVRLLRRIVRDNNTRGAHALTTVDYWPMIERSEENYFRDYLSNADFYINSFLPYEAIVIAPLARENILDALKAVEENTIKPSVFMERSNINKPFADLSASLRRCSKLLVHLYKIPAVNKAWVPVDSILNEFISVD